MRKKLLSLALVIAVLAVWGLVGFRIWNLTRPEITQSAKTEKKAEDHSIPNDSLRLDYRDPFLESGKAKIVVPTEKVAAIPESPAQMPSLKYKGMVKGRLELSRLLLRTKERSCLLQKVECLRRFASLRLSRSIFWSGSEMKHI